MNNIFLDMSDLDENKAKSLCYGVKSFLHSKKDVNITALGDINHLITLNGVNNINIINLHKKTTFIDEFSKYISEKGNDFTFATFKTKSKIIKLAKEKLTKTVDFPFFCSFFLNAKSEKYTLLADLGYKPYPSKDELFAYQKTMVTIIKEFRNIDNPSSKLLLPSGLVKTDNMKEMIEKLKEYPSYKGELSTIDMLQADCDILLGDPLIIQSTISGIDQGVSLFNEHFEEGMKHSFQFKFGGMFVKKLIESFNAAVDKKITSGGQLFVGYDLNIVLIRDDISANEVKNSLDLAYEASITNIHSKL